MAHDTHIQTSPWYVVMAYIVMACIVLAHDTHMQANPWKKTLERGSARTKIQYAYVVMAYIGMARIVMALMAS